MSIRYAYILIICNSLILCGCSALDSENTDIKSNLVGTWELDSISQPDGTFFKNEDKRILTFKNEADYSYEWENDDVGNVFIGKYFVLFNPKRKLKTISFIPDLQSDDKESVIRISYMNFDIVTIDSKRLHVVDKTVFIQRDGLRAIRFTKNYVYKIMK